MTLNEELSKLWRKYEESWGFEIPPSVRQYYEERCISADTTVEDLGSDLDAMSPMVALAHSKGAHLKKEAPQRKGTYMGPFMNRINLAKKITSTLIDLGQDLDKRKRWVPVANKINTENPSDQQVTPDALRKDYQHAMSDTAVAGSVDAWLARQLERAQPPDEGSTVSFSAKRKGGKS